MSVRNLIHHVPSIYLFVQSQYICGTSTHTPMGNNYTNYRGRGSNPPFPKQVPRPPWQVQTMGAGRKRQSRWLHQERRFRKTTHSSYLLND